MAEISFKLYDCNGRELTVSGVEAYELSRNSDAPCDSLRLTFEREELLSEIISADMLSDGELIFRGLCDMQKDETTADGFKAVLYFRSMAAVLVDNEAQPYTYDSPTARSMFITYADRYGFKFDMDDCACDGKYPVMKGCSCYAAINTLVSEVRGKNIIVTPDMRLVLPDEKQVYKAEKDDIIRERRRINRGEVLSVIDYKTAEEPSYSRHFKSRFAERNRIDRARKINLTSLGAWQREYQLKNALKAGLKKYRSLEVTLSGAHNIGLYSLLEYDSAFGGNCGEYRVSGVYISFDSRGERTVVELERNYDMEEIMYVD